MDMAFIKVLNMSISASWLVLAILLIRLLLKKSPKWIHVALWGLVAIRLICPFSIESSVSLVPSTQTVPEEVFYMEPVYHSQNVSLQIVEPRPNVASVDVDLGKTVSRIQTLELKWSLLWPAGMLVMMLWAVISYMRLKRKVDASVDVGNDVYICDYINTPFILGIVKPKIYLPSSMDPDSVSHVLAHERAHIARKDHWWKPFGYLLLSVYWFNPVLWLGYILLCRDIELACDEKVIRDMELPQKKAYSEALLSCSVNRRYVAACPLAFGEVGVKKRVKTVLNYKKPAFWIVLVAILALIVTAVCFLTDPKTEDLEIAEPAGESPYTWTSTLEVWDIRKAWSYQNGEKLLTNTIEGSALDTLTELFRSIREEEILHREISGQEDPYWVIQAPSLNLLCTDGTNVWVRYVDDTVIIGADTASGLWETKGYWVIENEAVKTWMHSISLGGTDMLSKENRDEIRQLLRFESVYFFDPHEYNGMLFVGCYYDGGRGIGVAVYEPLADGYRLLKLIRGDEVKRCASGSEVYYCDYQDMRIFLILNQSITGMEWAGAYEASYVLDTHPGLIVEYFPEKLNTMYRFLYGGENSTMYMDWNNRTHGQPPEYAPDPFADPDDAYSICSNLQLNQVGLIWAQAILAPDAYHLQGFVTELSREQMVEFLNLLRSIPETAYEQAQFPEEGAYSLEVFVFDVPTAPWLSLKRYEDAVYFQFHSDAQTVHQSWKIKSAELCGYIDHFFVGDLSQWDRFAPYPKMEGEVSCKFDNVEIVVPKYAGFEYEVTDAGLRFKPIEESGWVLLQYLDAPYAPEDSNLKLFNGIHFNYHSIRGCYEGMEVWTFVDITIPDEEKEHHILLLNEDNASWVEGYEYDIGWLLDVNEMEIRVNG